MPSLYITEPGAVLRASGQSFLVTVDEDPDGSGPAPERRRVILEVEPHRLELIALVGRAHATSDAVLACLRHGISLAYLSRSGELLGRLVPQGARAADLRLAQYAAASCPDRRLARARQVVQAKLANAAEVLEDIRSNDPALTSLAPAIEELKNLSAQAASCPLMEQLLGLEGAGTARYFAALALAFRGDIAFTGRARRPPPDPANALLSFGYVLLGNLIAGAIEARGLDPALGFYHELRPGRASLALDLLEELRHPAVDRFVLRSCNLRIFRPDMFEPDPENPGGVRLTRDALKSFFAEWERHLARPLRERGSDERLSVPQLIRRQVDRLAADLRGGPPYAPFRFGD